MIAYIGVVQSFTQHNPRAIHSHTYAHIQKDVPDAEYRTLLGEGHPNEAYRATMAREPEPFLEQLPFYSVKPLYPGLMFLLNRVGIGLVPASVLISKAAYLLIGTLLWSWIGKYYRPLSAFCLTSLIASLPFVLGLASHSTPDALSSAIVLLGLYLFAETSRVKAAYWLLLLSITARPDNVIIVILLALYELVFTKEHRGFSLSLAVCAVGLYKLQTVWSGNYGWTTLFYHSQIQLLTSPASVPPSLSLADYLKVIARYSHPLKLVASSYSLVLFVLLAVLTLRLESHEGLLATRRFQVLVVSIIYAGIHWLIFPHQKERVLAGWFLFILVMLTTVIEKKLHPRDRQLGRGPQCCDSGRG